MPYPKFVLISFKFGLLVLTFEFILTIFSLSLSKIFLNLLTVLSYFFSVQLESQVLLRSTELTWKGEDCFIKGICNPMFRQILIVFRFKRKLLSFCWKREASMIFEMAIGSEILLSLFWFQVLFVKYRDFRGKFTFTSIKPTIFELISRQIFRR